jgi:hypothetical protein
MTSLQYLQPRIEDVVRVTVDGREVGFCPPGLARGCFDLQTRGHGMDYAGVTVWPNVHFRLFTGGPTKYRDISFGRLCFQQEIYIYLREMGAAIKDALESLKITVHDELPQVVCPQCKQVFAKKHKQKFCSVPCRNKWFAWSALQRKIAIRQVEAARPKTVIDCYHCGKPIQQLSNRGRRRTFCDVVCRVKYRQFGRFISSLPPAEEG